MCLASNDPLFCSANLIVQLFRGLSPSQREPRPSEGVCKVILGAGLGVLPNTENE